MSLVKISDDDNEINQLSVFLKSIGNNSKLKIYKEKDIYYINSCFIMTLLGVEKTKFKSRSIKNIHYIIIKNKIYVSKYGITKLLANSCEPISFKLQDYIYEVLYKLESKKVISINDISSRSMLIENLQSKVDNYKLNEDNIINSLNKKNILINDLQNQINELMNLNQLYMEKNNTLVNNYENTLNNYNALLKASKSLAKYAKSTNKKTKALNYVSDICDDYDDFTYNSDELLNRALNAKKTINVLTKKVVKKVDSNLSCYLLRSAYCSSKCNGDLFFKWEIFDKKFYLKKYTNLSFDKYKEYSNNYLLNGIESKYEKVLYSELSLDQLQYNTLCLILDNFSECSIETIDLILQNKLLK